jgi:hypothetical protein
MDSASYRFAPILEDILPFHAQIRRRGVDIEQLAGCLNQAVDAISLRDACQELSKRHFMQATCARPDVGGLS